MSIVKDNSFLYEYGPLGVDEYNVLVINALNVPGEVTDPPNKIIRGNIVENDIAATLDLSDNVPHYLKNSIMSKTHPILDIR